MAHEIIETEEGTFYRNEETRETIPAHEAYFHAPVEFCRENVVAPLERVIDETDGDVKATISSVISFLNYCFEEKSTLEWAEVPEEWENDLPDFEALREKGLKALKESMLKSSLAEKDDGIKIRTAEDLADWLKQFGEKPIRYCHISDEDEEVFFEGLLDSASDDLLLKIIDYDEDPKDEVFDTINSTCCFVELQFAEYVEIMRSIYYVKETLHELLSFKLFENSRIIGAAIKDCIKSLESELSFYFYDF